MNYLLYIDANKGYFSSGNAYHTLEMDLSSANIIRDLEIVHKENLEVLIQSFVVTNKIAPGDIIVFLSSVFTFEKDFTDLTAPKQYEDIQSYLSTVPFEEIYSRTYEINKISKVVAANKDFCDAFINSFKKMKITVDGIVPLVIIQAAIPELSDKIDLKLFFDKIDSLRQYRIFTLDKKVVIAQQSTSSNKTPPPKSKRPMILSGVFACMLIVLFIMILTNVLAPQPVKKINRTVLPPLPQQQSETQVISGNGNESTPAASITPQQNVVQGADSQSGGIVPIR